VRRQVDAEKMRQRRDELRKKAQEKAEDKS